MKLSPPWVKFYHELEALFEQDPEVTVSFDEENYLIKLYVDNIRKADALMKLIPAEKEFGNVKVTISVIPANPENESKLDLFMEAFSGNPALRYVWRADTVMGNYDYVVFQNKVVQYFNDDLSDINGNCSTLFQEIAKDVFGGEVFYCTEAANSELTKPLGEWP